MSDAVTPPTINVEGLDPALLNTTVKFKANGADREVPLAEVFKQAGLGYKYNEAQSRAAELEGKYAEANKTAESAKQAMAVLADLEKAKANDPDALVRVAPYLGIPEDAALRAADAIRSGKKVVPPAGAARGDDDPPPAINPYDPQNMPGWMLELKQFIEKAKAEGIDPLGAIKGVTSYTRSQVIDQSKAHVRAVLENDDVLAKMVADKDSGQSIFDDLWKRIQGRVAAGEPFETKAIPGAIAEVRGILDAFDRTTPRPQATFGQPGSLGAIPGASVGSRLHPPKAPVFEDKQYQGDGGVSKFIADKLAYDTFKNGKPLTASGD